MSNWFGSELRLVCLLVALGGCGNPGGSSTDRVPVTRTSTGDLVPRASACPIEVVTIDGAVRASVTPASLFLELRQGTCSNPGPVVAASPSGRLSQNVRAGTYHVRVTNASDAPASYSLTVEYTTPSV